MGRERHAVGQIVTTVGGERLAQDAGSAIPTDGCRADAALLRRDRPSRQLPATPQRLGIARRMAARELPDHRARRSFQAPAEANSIPRKLLAQVARQAERVWTVDTTC